MKQFAVLILIALPIFGNASAAAPDSVASKPSSLEAPASPAQPWLSQIDSPYANQLGAISGLSVLAGLEAATPDLLAASQTPYYAMVKDASRAGFSMALGGGRQLRFSAVAGNAVGIEKLGPALNDHGKRFLSSAEFEQKVGRAVGILTVGMLREVGSMLGSQQGGALALNVRPTTTFTSASAGYALSSDSSLLAMASYSKTEGFGSTDSLIAQVSTVRTVAYSMGFATKQLFNSHDRFGLTLSMPSKVRSGSMQFSGALAGETGTLSYANQTLNLRPTATERDLEMAYSTVLGKSGQLGKLTGAMMWRVNPGHDAMAKPDLLMGVRYARGF